MPVRFDVFSLKGGVGKTSVAVMLAKAIASDTKMVLLIDADLTGSCMGDLLERELGWSSAPDLTGLITGEPELLAESLYATKLPVYAWMRSHDPGCMGHYSTKWMNRRWQEKSRYSGVAAQLSGVLFCPSACVHGEGIRSHRVINALLAHESAGGWIQTVIDEVIDATNQCLKKAGNVELAAVIVDHGPGFGALQCASLDRIDTPPVPESKDAWLRRGIIVGSPDHVDLQSLQMFEATRGQWRGASRFTWLINRENEQDDSFAEHDWYRSRVALKHDEQWARSFRTSRISTAMPSTENQAAIRSLIDRATSTEVAGGA